MSEKTYKIIRHFQSKPAEVIETGLTLAEAQEHCRNPETSSRTCSMGPGISRAMLYGPWFDGYDEE